MNVVWFYYIALQIISYPINHFSYYLICIRLSNMLNLQEFKSLIERPEISDYDIINKYSKVQINSESALKDVKKACNQALLPLHSDKTADYDKDEYLKVSAVKDSLRLYHEKIEAAEVDYRQYVEEVVKKEKERIERLRQEEEEEKWILVRKKKKDERKANRSPGGNNKKKNTRGKHINSFLIVHLYICSVVSLTVHLLYL